MVLDPQKTGRTLTERPSLFAMVTMATSREYTRHALSSFFKHTPLRPIDRVVLINNADPSAAKMVAPYVSLELLTRDTPLGFAANVNSMIAEALMTSADLYFLNNDIIFSDGWLFPLLESERSI